MSRLQSTFSRLRSAGRKALIPYLTAGDPDLVTTLGLMQALVKNGADVIELGYPFSDPSSDGPVIQRAVERALARKTTLYDVLELVAQFRTVDQQTPVVLMGYLNPVECMGYERFAATAVEAGVDGVLIVDLPPEEAGEPKRVLRAAGLDTIFLVAPTTNDERMQRICQESSGYVYYVSLKGVTGAAHLDVDSVAASLAKLRRHTNLPIGVGFGIRDGESAARIGALADAVVVGSALVSRIAELAPEQNYSQARLIEQTAVIASMREALDKRT
ncbi:MAG: tryptophan synthase subunit alpha [Pseudomonadales bacterium]|jgi:tryptophan synthase alpha chain|nr:tryptophan synthase subunit alpha [Pseudomonadales bacterium]